MAPGLVPLLSFAVLLPPSLQLNNATINPEINIAFFIPTINQL
jgi:hypothetical protein